MKVPPGMPAANIGESCMHSIDPALRERQRCVEICRRRAELWRNTAAARSSIAAAQDEARARANEAAYLADLLESGEELAPPGDEPADA